jgi:hypothetical protein
MEPISLRQRIAAACLFLVFGGIAAYAELGSSPALVDVLSLAAVLSFLLGLVLTPRVLFGALRLTRSKPLWPLPRSLAIGMAGFAVFIAASVLARYV